MNTITYQRLTRKNLCINSLDKYERYQQVTRCWRKIDNKWILISNEYIEDWNLDKLRCIANDLLSAIDQNCIVYGAFNNDELVGFVLVMNTFFGIQNQYIELNMLQVSKPFRGKGIGKKLFKMAAEDAKNICAKKLYISAHSSKESQAFYKAVGCVEASEINQTIVEREPFDCQMEYVL